MGKTRNKDEVVGIRFDAPEREQLEKEAAARDPDNKKLGPYLRYLIRTHPERKKAVK